MRVLSCGTSWRTVCAASSHAIGEAVALLRARVRRHGRRLLHRRAPDIRLAGSQRPTIFVDERWTAFRPSSDWSHAGRLIEREKISIGFLGDHWLAEVGYSDREELALPVAAASTPLVAAMRAYVLSRQGGSVEPDAAQASPRHDGSTALPPGPVSRR